MVLKRNEITDDYITKYPFHLHVDSSNVGTGCILIQQFPEGKRIISFNSRVFAKEDVHST